MIKYQDITKSVAEQAEETAKVVRELRIRRLGAEGDELRGAARQAGQLQDRLGERGALGRQVGVVAAKTAEPRIDPQPLDRLEQLPRAAAGPLVELLRIEVLGRGGRQGPAVGDIVERLGEQRVEGA